MLNIAIVIFILVMLVCAFLVKKKPPLPLELFNGEKLLFQDGYFGNCIYITNKRVVHKCGVQQEFFLKQIESVNKTGMYLDIQGVGGRKIRLIIGGVTGFSKDLQKHITQAIAENC